MATTKTKRCTGSSRFGIEPHDAPIKDFPKQPSRPDGLGTMCAPHWKAYVKGLAADRKARASGAPAKGAEPPTTKPARTKATTGITTKRERRRTPMAHVPAKPESPRVRKAREKLAEVESLAGAAYTEAIGSDEVQDALETVNGHATSEPDDGQVLVAGVLYDAETLEETEPLGTPIGGIVDGGAEEADAA
jgi:hypothetical protein